MKSLVKPDPDKKRSVLSENEFRDQLKKLRKHQYRNCRNCINFMRVKELNTTKPRGFCRLGELEGDFTFYVSSSQANECDAWVFDEHHAYIKALEDNISDMWFDKKMRNNDAITKALQGKIGFAEMISINEAKWRKFKSDNMEAFEQIRNLCEFDKRDYRKLLDIITLFIQKYVESVKHGKK